MGGLLTGICRRAIMRSRVDLPLPLGPTRPYRRPAATVSVVFSSRILPLARIVMLCTCSPAGQGQGRQCGQCGQAA